MEEYKEALTDVMQTLWAIGVSARAAAEKIAVILDAMEKAPKPVLGMTEIEEAELKAWCRRQTKERLYAEFDSVSTGLRTGFYTDAEAPRMLDRQVILAEALDRFYAKEDAETDRLLDDFWAHEQAEENGNDAE